MNSEVDRLQADKLGGINTWISLNDVRDNDDMVNPSAVAAATAVADGDYDVQICQ